MKQFRQGDVLIQEVKSFPKDAKREQRERIILAYGEVTGHCHEVAEVDNIELLTNEKGEMFLNVLDDSHVTHQEHSVIDLPVGKYQVIRQREYSPMEIRNVAD